jgi:toxin secretion/phage lysis holin
MHEVQSGDRFDLGRWIAATAGASVGAFLLGLDAAVWLLLGAQALDFASGVLAAGIKRELDSRVGWSGLLRKVLVWCQVAAAGLIQRYLASFGATVAIPLPVVGDLQLPAIGLVAAVCVGYGAVELMSVAENCKRGGIWVPTWLTERLGRFQPPSNERPLASAQAGD